ncbi:MAG: ABC transporter ATP-binding protein, partial [Deltaproteobacteria bacterium]|nr:ABC transporter ATP-binding protein [Deltaproteobacteria bacterium]
MYADFGYMEEGKLGKPYDLKLMVRLGTFLRRYWFLMSLSLFFVLVMAGLDLVIPYLTKEAIDRYIIPSAREILLQRDRSPEENQLLQRFKNDLIPTPKEGRFLLPRDAFNSLDRREAALLEKSGMLSENRYYLFVPQRPEEEALLVNYPSSFEMSGAYCFISLDRMKDLKREDRISLRGRDIEGVLRLALIIVFILFAHFGLNFVQVYAMEVAGQKMMHDLRMKVFIHLQNLPVSFFDRTPVGRLVTRLTNDIQNVHEMFTSVLINLFKDVILLIGIIAILLHLHVEMALISFAVLPLIFVTTVFFSRKARDAFRDIRFKV